MVWDRVGMVIMVWERMGDFQVFFLVGSTFFRVSSLSFSQVTHIAEADEQGVINKRLSPQEGVVYETTHPRGLCAGVTGVCDGCALAPFRTTTEAYPDSPDARYSNLLALLVQKTGY